MTDRQDEISHKVQKIQQWLKDSELDGILIKENLSQVGELTGESEVKIISD